MFNAKFRSPICIGGGRSLLPSSASQQTVSRRRVITEAQKLSTYVSSHPCANPALFSDTDQLLKACRNAWRDSTVPGHEFKLKLSSTLIGNTTKRYFLTSGEVHVIRQQQSDSSLSSTPLGKDKLWTFLQQDKNLVVVKDTDLPFAPILLLNVSNLLEGEQKNRKFIEFNEEIIDISQGKTTILLIYIQIQQGEPRTFLMFVQIHIQIQKGKAKILSMILGRIQLYSLKLA